MYYFSKPPFLISTSNSCFFMFTIKITSSLKLYSKFCKLTRGTSLNKSGRMRFSNWEKTNFEGKKQKSLWRGVGFRQPVTTKARVSPFYFSSSNTSSSLLSNESLRLVFSFYDLRDFISTSELRNKTRTIRGIRVERKIRAERNEYRDTRDRLGKNYKCTWCVYALWCMCACMCVCRNAYANTAFLHGRRSSSSVIELATNSK